MAPSSAPGGRSAAGAPGRREGRVRRSPGPQTARPPEETGTALPLRKRLAFAAVVVAGVWLTGELLAFAAFWVLDGEPFRFARLRAERREIAGWVAEEEAGEEAPAGEDPLARLDSQAVHPYLGFVFDPLFAARYQGPDPLLRRLRVGEWGFPGLAPPFRRRAPDRVIVGVLGGSVARLFATGAGRRLERLLADHPAFRGRELELVVLAVDGHKQPQQLATVAYLLALGAEFDVLLNIDGFNEVALHEAENGLRQVHPVYPRAWFAFAEDLPNPRRRAALGRLAYAREWRRDLARALSGSVWRFSVAANLVWRSADRLLAARIFAGQEQLARAGGAERRYAVTGPEHAYPTRASLYEALAELWWRSSLQLDRLARANDIAYVHVLQPNQYLPGSKPLGEREREVAFDEDHPYRPGVESGYPLLLRDGARLRERGVRFADLTGIFRDVEEAVYSDDCCHLNRRGNALLADAIAAFLGAHPDAGPARGPR